MTFLFLRRPACCVPVVLSLWGAGSASAIGAESTTISTPTRTPVDTTLDATTPLAADDPAAPDAPTGPLPAGVLNDFSRPALSVATSDWRMVNASVSGMSGMSGMPQTPEASGTPAATSNPPAGHAGHSMHGGSQ